MKVWSPHEYNYGGDVILHVMLRVPFFCCTFYQLLATILRVLSLVEMGHCLFKLVVRYLVADTVGAYQNGSISEPVPWYYFNSWVRNHTASCSHSVSKTSWHCQTWLPRLFGPHPHRAYLFSGGSGLELVKDSSCSKDSLGFFRCIRFMIDRQLFYFQPCLMRGSFCKFIFAYIFENVYRRVTYVSDYQVVLLDQEHWACAPWELNKVSLSTSLCLHFFVSLSHLCVSLIKRIFNLLLYFIISLLGFIFYFLF